MRAAELPDRAPGGWTLLVVAVLAVSLGAGVGMASMAVHSHSLDGIAGSSIQTGSDVVFIYSSSIVGSDQIEAVEVRLGHNSEHLVNCRLSSRLRTTRGGTVTDAAGRVDIYSNGTETVRLNYGSPTNRTAYAIYQLESSDCRMLGWPMLGFNASHRGAPTALIGSIEGPETLDRVWATDGSVTDTPTVDGETVYVGRSDTIEARYAANGSIRWSYPTGGPVSVGAVSNRIYAGSEDGSVYALYANGTLDWSTPTGGPVRTAPATDGDRVYVGSNKSITALYANGTVDWSTPTGGNVTARPVVANGTVYAGSAGGSVYAIDTNGTLQWTTATGGPVRAAPAVVGDSVYVGSDSGRIYALKTSDGSVRWKNATGGVVRSAPAVVNGTVYAGSADGSLYALNHTDGTRRWTVDLGADVRSGPAFANGTLYVGTDGATVYAIDEDTGGVIATAETDGPVRAGPTVTAGRLYVTADSAYAFGLVPETWPSFQSGPGNTGSGDTTPPTGSVSERWATGTGVDPAAPSVYNETVLVGGDAVYALNETTGTQEWRTPIGGSVGGTPVVAGETVYATAGQRVHALRIGDGSERWQYDTGANIDAPVTVADDRVYVGTGDGLYALYTNGTVDWSVATDPISVAPAVYNGTVFVGAGRNVTAYDGATGAKQWSLDVGTNVSTAVTAAADGVFVGTGANEGPLVREHRTDLLAQWERGTYDATSADGATGADAGRLSLGYSNGTASDDLVGYYRFDRPNSAGGTVQDYSGDGNDGTLVNQTETGVEGVFDTDAYRFDGNGSHVTQQALYSDQVPMTISLWYNWSAGKLGGQTFLGAFNNNETSLRVTNGTNYTTIVFQTWSSEFGSSGLVGVDALDAGQWTHLVAVAEPVPGSDNVTYRLYSNGTEIANTTDRWTPAQSHPLHIGARNIGSSNDRFFPGELDEIRLYEAALTDEQVHQLYRYGRDGTFEGNYSRTVRTNRPHHYQRAEIDVGVIPPGATLDATVSALDRDGRVLANQTVSLSEGTSSVDLDLPPTRDARISLAGTSPSFRDTWIVDRISLVREQASPGTTVVAARQDWARGTSDATSADAATGDRSGALTLGYANGTGSDDLVGYWRLDGSPAGTNGTVRGYDGTNRSGLTNGGVATGATGALGTSAYTFDGTDDYLTVPYDPALNITSSFTVSAWANPDALDGDYEPIVSKDNHQWGIQIGETDRWKVFVHNGSGWTSVVGSTPTAGAWTHVTGRYDAASDELSLWINGSKVGSATVSSINGTDTPLMIGSNPRTTGRYFNGSIDEPRVYARALSATEIETLSRRSGSDFAGSYRQTIDTDRLHDWRTLRANVTARPAGSTLDATIYALNPDGTIRDQQTVSLGAGTTATTLALNRSQDARIEVSGTVGNATESWRVEGLTLSGPVLDCRGCWGGTVGGRAYSAGTFNATSTAGESGVPSENLSLRYSNGSDEAGLMGYWRLDRAVDRTGGTVAEYSGSNLTGDTRGGVTTGVSGVFDTAAYGFGGASGGDDVTFGNRAALATNESFTATMWVNSDVADGSLRWVLADGQAMNLRQNFNNKWEVSIDGGSAVATGSAVTTGTWVHLAVRYNATSEETSLWVNGTRAASTTYAIPQSSTPLALTNNTEITYRKQFDGRIDEVRFYDRPLDGDRIDRLARFRSSGDARGSYERTIRTTARQDPTQLVANVTALPASASLSATVETIATTGAVQGTQTVSLDSSGTTTHPLSVAPGTDLRVTINGSTADIATTWGVQNVTVDREVVPSIASLGTNRSTIDDPADWDAGSYDGTSIDGSSGRENGTLTMRYANGTAGDSLVGFWRHDTRVDGTNGTVPDYSGAGHAGVTKAGVTTTATGVFDSGAYRFDGSDDYIDLGNASDLNQTDSFTVAAWVNLDEEDGTYHPIVQKGDTQWGLRVNDGSNAWYFYAYDGSSWTGVIGDPATAGTWTHVAGRYNATSDQLSLWVDGEKIGAKSISTIASNTYNLTIGTDAENPGRHFDGRIDEVRLYDRALSNDAMATLGRTSADGTLDGQYTQTILTNTTQRWTDLTVDAPALPDSTDLTVKVTSIADGSVQGTDSVQIDSAGTTTRAVDVPDASDARITVDGSTTDPARTWSVTNVSLKHERLLSSTVSVERSWPTDTAPDWDEGSYWATATDTATGNLTNELTLGYSNGTAGDHLVGYYRLDGDPAGTGGTVADYSGENRTGRTYGNISTNRTGVFGTSAYAFDATDDNVTLGQPDALNFTGSFTISTWVYANGTTGDNRAIVGKGDTQYMLRKDSTDEWNVFIEDSGTYTGISSPTQIATDTWVHLAARYDAASDELTLWVNGTQVNSATGTISANTYDVAIGTNTEVSGRNFNGYIDEVRFYNRSLSDSAIERLYPGGSPHAGNYTRSLSLDQTANWQQLRANVSALPTGTGVTATVHAISGGSIVDNQTVTLSGGASTTSLSLESTATLRLDINGTTTNLTRSWRVDNVTVAYGSEIDAKDHELAALDPATGDYLWGRDLETTVAGSPALANGTLYPGLANGTVPALNASDGERVWRLDWPRSPVRAPAVAAETIVVGTEEGRLRAHWTNASQRWAIRPDSRATAPAVLNATVFVGGSDSTRAID